MMRNANRTRAQQGGYALLGTFFALAILVSIVAMGMQLAARYTLQKRAEIEGEALGQFAVGLRGFVAAAQANSSLIPAGPQSGVNWLKAPTCGGLGSNPAQGYVPCSYTGATFGRLYSTSFTYVAATNQITVRTSFSVSTPGNYNAQDAILMADRLVQTATSQQSLPNNGMFYQAFANVPATASAPPSGAAIYNPGADAGRVVALVNNAPSNDIWLRTEGTNMMLANLNMGGMSIGNARDARFTGRVQVDNGMVVTSGTTDLRGGLVTPDIALTSVGKAASQGIYDARVLTGAADYWINKPDCSQAGGLPSIYVGLQSSGTINAAGYRADALYESRADVYDSGGSWRIVPVVRGTKFDISNNGTDLVFSKSVVELSPVDQRLVALIRCK